MYTFIGCSGFHYDGWKGIFYPEELPKEQWLSFYAEHFKSVEINNSFYRLPQADTLKKWYEQTPGHFRFSMKGSRYVTHMKKLVDDEDLHEGIKKFYEVVETLRGKLGCVLWQLPGNLHRHDEKLKNFCSLLSSDVKNVIEFRHESWFVDPVFEILEAHNVSYCIISAPEALPDIVRSTNDTAYVRFHGTSEMYDYAYSDDEIKDWSCKLQALSVRRIYVYFNNDYEASAVKNAKSMNREFEVMKEKR
ncbi:MAG TPA: DUF72 domain-containing protein [Balneolaceae bacterium]|nr:DUF72 domain-containing protein [Balneolaceae bacterium]